MEQSVIISKGKKKNPDNIPFFGINTYTKESFYVFFLCNRKCDQHFEFDILQLKNKQSMKWQQEQGRCIR